MSFRSVKAARGVVAASALALALPALAQEPAPAATPEPQAQSGIEEIITGLRPLSGISATVLASTTRLSVAVLVSSKGVSAVTSTTSLMFPTCRATSIRTVLSTCTKCGHRIRKPCV